MAMEKERHRRTCSALFLIALFILLILNGCLPASVDGAKAKAVFVTRSGSSLLLNGQNFRFAGANIHWLALDDYGNYSSQFRINDALDVAREMGLTTVRSLSMGISTGCSNCIESKLGNFNAKALEQDDYIIKEAEACGLRLIIPLTDNYHYATGGKHTFTDWRGISDENQFYTDQQVINDFETYIRTLLNHVNIYTGVAYKNDPTIMAWETGNELQPPTAWTQNISSYIKSLDPNHLVIDGRYGIDPNAASLTQVDILSDHYYPKSISRMNTDAQEAKQAGKAFVIGEFDWNDANGGDSLQNFLASVQSTPAVAGDAFWELWPHDDQYGYRSSVAQYTLHYPGNSGNERNSGVLLRLYAYKMRNQAVPAFSIPAAPLLETVVTGVSGNTLIWRGSANTATYSIERSTVGMQGPWSVICNKCATDYDTPWTDTQYLPTGTLWYRVIPYNLDGVAGVPSQAYQAGANQEIIDTLANWSHVYQHSTNLSLNTTNIKAINGDSPHVLRTTSTREFIIWKQSHITAFQVSAYFWSQEPVSPFSIYTSSDGVTWSVAKPQIISINRDWEPYVYTLQRLSDVNYVKVQWNNTTGHAWNPALGTVSILY